MSRRPRVASPLPGAPRFALQSQGSAVLRLLKPAVFRGWGRLGSNTQWARAVAAAGPVAQEGYLPCAKDRMPVITVMVIKT